MEPIVSSEMSAIRTQMPGNYPKRNKLHYLLLCNVALAEDTVSLSYMHFMVFHVALSDIICSLFVL